jgi:hypothetical protein
MIASIPKPPGPPPGPQPRPKPPPPPPGRLLIAVRSVVGTTHRRDYPDAPLLFEEADLSGGFTSIQALGCHYHRHLCVMLCDDHGAALIVPALKPDRCAPNAHSIGGNTSHRKHHLFVGV